MDDRLKLFWAWDVMGGRREIFSPEESLPSDDLVFFLLDLIPQLDLTAIYGFYSKDRRGQPPFSVEMMITLLVYSYSVGVFSSRKIAGACERNLAFLAIVGNDCPDFRTISDFRKHHQAAMKPLFLEVLRVAGELGMVKLGNLSTDGTKIDANASRHKAMSYGYMQKDLERLQAEIDKLLEHFHNSSSAVSLALLQSPQSRRTAMGKPYLVDLRVRVLSAVDGGDSVDEVAERFAVTARTVWSWLALRKSTGTVEPRKGAVGPKPKLEEHREKIEAAIQSSPSLTLKELRLKLQLPGCVTTLWKALERWRQSLKKSDVRR